MSIFFLIFFFSCHCLEGSNSGLQIKIPKPTLPLIYFECLSPEIPKIVEMTTAEILARSGKVVSGNKNRKSCQSQTIQMLLNVPKQPVLLNVPKKPMRNSMQKSNTMHDLLALSNIQQEVFVPEQGQLFAPKPRKAGLYHRHS